MSIAKQDEGPAVSLPQQGKEAVQDAAASPLMETLMRIGHVVRGLVYGVIGLLAARVALGDGGQLVDPQGAIAAIGQSPLGTALLWFILIGLVGYGLWGFIRAIADPLHKGNDAKGIATRIGYAVSGVSYFMLAVVTYQIIAASASAAQNNAQPQETTARLLSQPWGAWVVGLAGLIVIVVGVMHIVKGFKGDFDQQFNAYAISPKQHRIITQLGRFGTAARGLVYALIGLFLLLTAVNNDPSQAKGIDGVLNELLQQPFGPALLLVVALGLMAFGVYSAMSGFWLRYKR
jgi:type IV secretory pathway VirB2 component (pilin)